MSDSKIVKEQGMKPCGCYVTIFADESSEIQPCAPCGLMETARALGAAAQTLAATAARIASDKQKAQLQRTIENVAKNSKPGG